LLAATLTQRLSEAGIERRTISAFALVLLIYSIKWAWAPIVDRVRLPFADRFGQRRTWLVLCAALVIVGIVLLAKADPSAGVQKVLLAALVLGFAGATYDIVIDAYRIELLEPEQLGTGSGMSQYGWRIGAFLAGTVALAGAAAVDWTFGYIACAPLALSAVLVSLVAGEPKRHKVREWPQRAEASSYQKLLLAIPLILAAATGLDWLLDSTMLFRIATFGLIYPLVDLTIRRAHDAGWSGHLAWLLLAPAGAALVGSLTLFWIALTLVAALILLLAFKPGDAGANRFGDAPDALVKRDVIGPMVEFFRRKGAWLVFIFVLVHKVGDTMANLMVRDLFVTEGFSKEEILFADVWVGFFSLMVGIFVGGIVYARWGMKKAVLISLRLEFQLRRARRDGPLGADDGLHHGLREFRQRSRWSCSRRLPLGGMQPALHGHAIRLAVGGGGDRRALPHRLACRPADRCDGLSQLLSAHDRSRLAGDPALLVDDALRPGRRRDRLRRHRRGG